MCVCVCVCVFVCLCVFEFVCVSNIYEKELASQKTQALVCNKMQIEHNHTHTHTHTHTHIYIYIYIYVCVILIIHHVKSHCPHQPSTMDDTTVSVAKLVVQPLAPPEAIQRTAMKQRERKFLFVA